ncbi:MAG TPA: SulP family inorganic anion transporter [Kofleriaceae bacterium]|nr:SulP family inorganic anion transporter [Kofleriaceae bacterium]
MRYGRQRSTRLPDSLGVFEPPESPTPSGAARARFSWETLKRDAPAGVITGLMAIPLNIGIAILSDYPIQIAIFTVVVACVLSFCCYLFRVGNHIGVPGVAAGLAPVLALGVHRYGHANMPWIIFLVATSQMIVWRYKLEGYILKVVPPYLIEGLLAGVGLKILMKFVPYTYEVVGKSSVFWSDERIHVVGWSIAAGILFLYLYKKFKDRSPGVPYIVVIGGSIWLATKVGFPMLHFDTVDIGLSSPFPDFGAIPVATHVEMVFFALMLSSVDIIEQVMSNAAIEKIDPLGRKANSNNSLLAIWIANMASATFQGMTNLDGLAKSSTNRIAGAVTKMSALFVAAVLAGTLVYPEMLQHLPKFSLAVLMIFTGWRMISGMYHTAHHGKYGFGLAAFCGILVFRLGIFEGLLIALAIHSFITYVVYRAEKLPHLQILKKLFALFQVTSGHPHATDTMDVEHDEVSGGTTYRSIVRSSTDKKDLSAFIEDWANGLNTRNLLSVVGTYDVDGLLWGTFAKDLRSGHFHIKRYFEHLFELEGLSVRFDSGETRQYHDIFIRSGSYTFSYRKKGTLVQVPARYSFVCKRERTGWYIVEHHSSEFPS